MFKTRHTTKVLGEKVWMDTDQATAGLNVATAIACARIASFVHRIKKER